MAVLNKNTQGLIEALEEEAQEKQNGQRSFKWSGNQSVSISCPFLHLTIGIIFTHYL